MTLGKASLRNNEERRHSASFLSISILGLCVLLCVYAIFPSESASERFSLFVRLFFLCFTALLAVVLGEIRREFIAVFSFLAFIFILLVSWSNAPYFTPRLVNLVASILCAGLVVAGLASGRANDFAIRVISGLLVFSAGALFLQLGIYLVTDSIVEFHGVVFPWGGSRSAELERFGIARLSGVHTEPGTHSAFTVGLIILRSLMGGRLFDRVAYLSMASVIATLSFWGVLATTLYFLLYAFSVIENKEGAKRVLTFFVLFAVASGVVYVGAPQYLIEDLIGYFSARAELGDGSGGAKVIAWVTGLQKLGDVVFFGLPIGADYCNGCMSPQDAGLVLNFMMFFGVTASILFFGVLVFGAYRCGGYALATFSALLLVVKFYYFDPIVWLIFFTATVCCLRSCRGRIRESERATF